MLRGKILKAISGDFKIKLLSILVAFSMWVFVMEEIDPKTIRSVKNIQITEITNIVEIEHEGLTLSYNQNLITNIDFRGKRSALADFVRETPKIKATIENPRVGLNEVILSIDVPNNIEYSFDPAIIKVNLEESVTEDRTVGYATSGEVLSGFEVVGVSLSEENINIEGPRSQVNKVDSLLVTIDINNVKKDFKSRVKAIPIDIKGEEVPGVKVNTDYVTANVKVSAVKEVPLKFDIVDNKNNLVENLIFELEESTIKIYGEKDDIDKIEYIYTDDLKLDEINRLSQYEYIVNIQRINGIAFNKNQVKLIAKNDLVDYNFEIEKEKIIFADEIGKGEILDILPNEIKVSFKSAKEYEISSEDITILIDNSSVLSEYKLNLYIGIPVFDIKINPDSILF